MANLDQVERVEGRSSALTGARWWLACGVVFAATLAVSVPTAGDLGLTWDEPAYRYSQMVSAQWWEQLARARSVEEVTALLQPDALLYYWPYARHGINFHPPLAGQLNLATHALFGRWMKDVPSRRMASVIEFALTITLGFGFLARRYGAWVGGVMAGALLFMPRVYGNAHLAETDTPGLLLWAATSLAFWKGLHDPNGRRWRVLVGVLLGLAFVEKMAAVIVILPLLAWLIVVELPGALTRRAGRSAWIDGALTTTAMLVPLGGAFLEVLRLKAKFPPPQNTNLFYDRPASLVPGVVLAIPMLVWFARRALGRLRPASPVWGRERPALETWTAILAFAPMVGWLGNPAWWRETLPRLTHYFMINSDRRGSLPEIWILYLGQLYEFSLPWHNGWVLMAITVPAAILIAAAAGLIDAIRRGRRDPLRLYFLVHFLTLPVLRMLPTPAHDGVRLLLPTFFYLAAFAGWGTVQVADTLARRLGRSPLGPRCVIAGLVLVSSAWQLVKVHPFELSYYNELVGGPRGARARGFELTYWYDAFNPSAIAEINERLPSGASVAFFTGKTEAPTFVELQALGDLRGDLQLGTEEPQSFPYAWILTQDAKASSQSRLLYAMTPFYVLAPPQLDGLRVASVAGPVAVSRALALNLLASEYGEPAPGVEVPGWVRRFAPRLGRFWGQGLTRAPVLKVNEPLFEWARDDPAGLRAAARTLVERRPIETDPRASELMAILSRYDDPTAGPGRSLAKQLLRLRPQALTEAVEILIARPDDVRKVLTRYAYTDVSELDGYLDKAEPGEPPGPGR